MIPGLKITPRGASMNFFSKAAGTIGDLRSSKKESLDSKLKEATSKATWNVPNSQLQSIALATHDPVDCNVVLTHCWKLLQDRTKDWRQVFKTLVLFETLLKHGSERCVEDIRSDLWKIQQWKEHRVMEQGKDVAGGIREKANSIEQLCNDKSLLQRERDKAHALSQKMTGMGAPTPGRRESKQLDNQGPSAFHSPFEKPEKKEKRSKNQKPAQEEGFARRPSQDTTEAERNAMVEKFCNATNATRLSARDYLANNGYDVNRAVDQYLADSSGEQNGGNRERRPGWFDQRKRIEQVVAVTKVSEESATELLERCNWDINSAVDRHLQTAGRSGGPGSNAHRQPQQPSRQNQRPASPSSASSSSGSSSSEDEAPANRGPQGNAGPWGSGTFGGPAGGQGGWPNAQGKGGFPSSGPTGGFGGGYGDFGGSKGGWPPTAAPGSGPGGWGSQAGPPGKGSSPWGAPPASGSFGGPVGGPQMGRGSFGGTEANPWGAPPQGQHGAANRSHSAGPSYSGAPLDSSFGGPSGPSNPGKGGPFGGGGGQPGSFGSKGGDAFGSKGGFGGPALGGPPNSFGGQPGGKGGCPGAFGMGSGSFGGGPQGGKGGGGFGPPPGGGFGGQPGASFGGGGFGGGGGQPFGGSRGGGPGGGFGGPRPPASGGFGGWG